MFGLEGQQKKKKVDEFVFELEKELKDPKKLQEIRAKWKCASKKSKTPCAQGMTSKNMTALR